HVVLVGITNVATDRSINRHRRRTYSCLLIDFHFNRTGPDIVRREERKFHCPILQRTHLVRHDGYWGRLWSCSIAGKNHLIVACGTREVFSNDLEALFRPHVIYAKTYHLWCWGRESPGMCGNKP